MGIIFDILTSRLVRRLLPVAIAACLIAVFWNDLLHILGVGIALLILVVAILIWAIWRHRLPFIRHWNRWLGAIAFAAALLGILAFFSPEDGIFSEDSLGGYLGKTIIGEESSTIMGVLRVAGLVIIGIAFIGPRFTWHLLRNLARRVVPALRQLGEWGQRSIKWLRQFYSQHPVHRIIIDWIKERRSRTKAEDESPASLPTQESGPPPITEPTPDVTIAPVKAAQEVPKLQSVPFSAPF